MHSSRCFIHGRCLYILMVLLHTLTKSVSCICLGYSTLVLDDFYLQDQLFLVTKASSLLDCATECAAYTDCLSFGFEPKKRTCHLHTADRSTSSLTVRTNWQYSDISLWPMDVFGPCARHSCETGKKCQVHRVTGSPVCVSGPFIRHTTGSNPSPVYDTIPNELFHKLTGNTSSLVFRVKACKTAIIQLVTTGDHEGLNKKLIVAYGDTGNTRIAISDVTRHPGVGRDHVQTTDLLDCNEFRTFWLDWTNSVISTGTGTKVNENRSVSWTFPDTFELVDVALSTYRSTSGTWLFYTQH